MKFLVKLVLGCCGLLVLLCGAVVAIASTTTAQAALPPEFGTCGQSLCYVGVVPDKTLFDDAASIVTKAQHDAIEVSSATFILPRAKTNVTFYSTTHTIDEIDISLKSGNVVSAGDIIRQFGDPCFAASLGTTLAVKYPHVAVFFAMENLGPVWRLNPTSRVIEIRLLGGAAKDCAPVDKDGVFRWRGFASYF